MKGKICIFCGFYPAIKGGAEYQSKIIAKELIRNGYDVFFISFGHESDELINQDGFRVYCFRNPRKIDTWTLYEFVGRKIKNVISQEKPKVIYQRILNSYSPHLAKIAKNNSIKYYIHIADNYSLIFDFKFRSRIRKLFFERIKKNIIKGANIKFIAQTRWQANRLKELGVFASMLIYNMHPLPSLEQEDEPKIDADNYLINGYLNVFWIANVRAIKRLDLMLKLASIFANKDVNFILIGKLSNCESSRALLENTLKNTFYLGERDNDFINSKLKYADFLLNTSDSEGFSNTFIQAWLRGVPVLSLNSDPDDLIKNNGLGVCANGDLNVLIKHIESGISKKYDWEVISHQCKDVSHRLFNFDVNLKKLLIEFGDD